jgi:hypothetical protein
LSRFTAIALTHFFDLLCQEAFLKIKKYFIIEFLRVKNWAESHKVSF